MELIGNDICKGSHMYFYTASQIARKLLYYPIAIGDFYCNNEYKVERDSYDSILALYVINGSMTMVQNGAELTAQRDELLLIDCYKPHKYFANGNAHTLLVHFNGNNSREWFSEIAVQKGQRIKCNRQTADCISNIIRLIKQNQSEYDISNELYSMLCSIAKGNDKACENEKAMQIEIAKQFIYKNFDKDITVDEMAKYINMSASYFSKVFKNITGFSPYDYLLTIRLDKAKELLRQTDNSIETIAFKTGFNSTSNFIYFFKKETGISPLKFRNVKF